MKVLFLSNIPAPYVVSYLNELGKKADVEAYFEKASFSHRDKSWSSFNAEHFRLTILSGISLNREFTIDFSFFREIRKNPDAIVLIANPLTPMGMLSILFCRIFGYTYGIQSEGGMAKRNRGIREIIKRFILPKADFYLSGMKGKNEYFTAYGADKSRVYYYPFASLAEKDMLSVRPDEKKKKELRGKLKIDSDKVVLFVGRVIQGKGIDVLIRAMNGFDSNCGVYIVGGTETEELRNLAATLGISNLYYIPFLSLKELKDYYMAADLFVLPTRYDTWGLVINEAMSYGLPVITTKNCVAGVELIQDGVNGYLTESEDYRDLNSKIHLILENESLAGDMAENNLKKIRDYTYEKMAATVFSVLEQYDPMKAKKSGYE